jgi:GDP-L-fucose synthase
MRVLLTGSTGMVGRNVLEHSQASSIEVLAPSRAELNLLDAADVDAFIRRVRPDAVFHTAGTVGGIQANMAEMSRFMVENADMGRNVILGAFHAGVRKLVNLGSSCMYPRNCDGVLTEDMLLAGELEPTNEGYAIAKNFAARLCHYLNRENSGLMYRTLIPCNLFGRWDHYNDLERSHLMAAIVTKIERAVETGAKEVTIWGTGTVRREFLYAGDLADCIWWTLENIERVPDCANCGTGVDATVADYYHTVASAAGFKGRFVYDNTKPDGMKRKLMDVSKLRSLGWAAETDLKKGIAHAVDFYREHCATMARENA